MLSSQFFKAMVSTGRWSVSSAYIDLHHECRLAEASGSIFQVRPHKEFVPSKGRDRLLSLRLLSELACDVDPNHDGSEDGSSATGIRNAYDFMQKRREVTGDPTMKRWNAAIRLANFASLESAPLCVSKL
jgi:DNA mismatch repair protein MSH5